MSELSESALRAEVRGWLEAHWDPELGLAEWRNKLIDSRWGAPHWPNAWYGRDLPLGLLPVVEEEFRRIGAVGVARTGIRALAAATILAHGTDGQKRKFLRRCLTGEDIWCQLFSEPGSGSDVAGATTRADFLGDHWVVNGQKLWTTSAQDAHWGLLLARTDWDAPKHKGLSVFILDMRQPGIQVYPLRQMNGYASFHQVFISDATISADGLVAEVNHGWSVCITTLMHERSSANLLAARPEAPVAAGRCIEEEQAETAATMEPYTWYPQRYGRVDLLMPHARLADRLDDPVIRQELAKVLILAKAAEWTASRARAAQKQGKPHGAEGSLQKLAASSVARAAARVHTQLAGAGALLSEEDGPMSGLIAEIILSTPATSIAGGTDEIQRNIIAERLLGMPKDIGPPSDQPFRDLLRNAAAKLVEE